MFSLGYNLYVYLKTSTERPVNLVLLGIDNAGKTSISSCIQQQTPDPDVVPSVGFKRVDVGEVGSYNLTLTDLGGGSRVRKLARHYLAESMGAIYVIDGSDRDRLDESLEYLQFILDNERFADKLVLCFVNKQDKEGAMTPREVEGRLGAAMGTRVFSCFGCTALTADGTIDPNIEQGLAWALKELGKSYKERRAAADAMYAEQVAEEKRQMEEKKARLAAIRAKRQADADAAAAAAAAAEGGKGGGGGDGGDGGAGSGTGKAGAGSSQPSAAGGSHLPDMASPPPAKKPTAAWGGGNSGGGGAAGDSLTPPGPAPSVGAASLRSAESVSDDYKSESSSSAGAGAGAGAGGNVNNEII